MHRPGARPIFKDMIIFHYIIVNLFPMILCNFGDLQPIRRIREPSDSLTYANSTYNSETIGHNMSDTLDLMLKNYNSMLRPLLDGDPSKPTKVLVDLNIRSMGPISEKDMSFSMDCYFRQTWNDPRLKYNGKKEIAVHIALLEKIWKPDTYFYNGKNSYLHTITTPNKLLRIFPDGTILYSMRLTIKADCPMQLQSYPMDTQYCPLTILSFGHGAKDMMFQWKYGNNQSIVLNDDVKLSQFDIVSYAHTNLTLQLGPMPYPALKVVFKLQRHMGYFLLQVYIPSILLVTMSWITFWLNREATGDRSELGITVILTMTTMNRDNNMDLPEIAYATALEVYVQMCFAFLIASMLEFVAVHYFTKHGGGDYHNIEYSTDEESDEEPTAEDIQRWKEDKKKEKDRKKRLRKSALARGIRIMSGGPVIEKHSFGRKFLNCLQGSHKYRNTMRRRAKRAGFGINSVSQLDKVSRVLFPAAFLILNVIYWSVYYFNGD